jgi:WD40 repeat protein
LLPSDANDVSTELFEFDAFLSYSTDPDYRLSRRVEGFLETFHLVKGPETVKLKQLQICRDGSDFRLSRVANVEETLESHLRRSKYLLVLCSKKATVSDYVHYEIRWFLQHRTADFILVAVTEGDDPTATPADVFPPLLLEAGLPLKPFYDLRGYRGRQANRWLKVRDMEEQLVNLAAHLQGQTAGKLLPIWQRDARRKARTQLTVAVAVILMLITLSIFSLVQRSRAESNAQKANENEAQALASAERARNFGLFSTGSLSTADPTLQVVILREIRGPLPSGWDAAAFEATRRAAAESILDLPGGAIVSVAFSADGRQLATGLATSTIGLWDAQTDTRTRQFTGQGGAIATLAFSYDGRRLLGVPGVVHFDSTSSRGSWVLGAYMVTDRSARVWDTEQHAAPIITTPAVQWASFANRGLSVCAVSEAGQVHEWLADGTRHAISLETKRKVHVATFSSDGRKVALGFLDGVMIANCDGSGSPVDIKTPYAKALAFTPDGASLAVSTGEGVRVWLTSGPARPCELKGVQSAESLTFSADGRRLVAGSPYNGAVLWTTSDGSWRHDSQPRLERVGGGTVRIVSSRFAAQGSKILARLADGTARFWETGDLTRSTELRGHSRDITAIAISSDGSQALTGSLDGTARRWSMADSERVLELRLHTQKVVAAEFDPAGTHIVAVTDGGDAMLWSAEEGGKPVTFGTHAVSATFSPGGTRILTTSADDVTRVWQADGSGPPTEHAQGGPLRAALFGPGGRTVLTSGCNGTVKLWQTGGATPRVYAIPKGSGGVQGQHCLKLLAISPDGRAIAAASDVTAYLWRVDAEADPLKLEGHENPIASLAFNRDGTRLLTSSWDRTARVWSTSSPLDPVVLADANEAAAFSPDGSRVVTGTRLGFSFSPGEFLARVFSADGNGSPLLLAGHTDRVHSVAFSADGSKIITGSQDGTARIWNADGTDEPVVLGGWDSPVRIAALSRNHEKALTISDDGALRVWRLDVRTLLWRQTSYCLPEARRRKLFGESLERSRAEEKQCRQVVARCQESTAACRAAVTTAYGNH